MEWPASGTRGDIIERKGVNRHDRRIGAGMIRAREQRLTLIEPYCRKTRPGIFHTTLRKLIALRVVTNKDLCEIANLNAGIQPALEDDARRTWHHHPVAVGHRGHDDFGRHRKIERTKGTDACDVRLIGKDQQSGARITLLDQHLMAQPAARTVEVRAMFRGECAHLAVILVIGAAHSGGCGVIDDQDHFVRPLQPRHTRLVHDAFASWPRDILATGIIGRDDDIFARLHARPSSGSGDDLLRYGLAPARCGGHILPSDATLTEHPH
jgi:hypothetical protein